MAYTVSPEKKAEWKKKATENVDKVKEESDKILEAIK